MAGAGACLGLFALAWTGYSRTVPERIEGTLAGETPTPYIRFIPFSDSPRPPAGTILIVHGLNSNKEFMQTLALALTDGGFETWAIDLPGHGDSEGAFDSEASLQAIGAAFDSLPEDTILVGHSLGAALIADLAMTRRFGKAILLSPPPIPLAPVGIGSLLVVSGRFDAPRINESIPPLLEAAGTDSRWRLLPWAGHSTSLYSPPALRMLVDWAGGSAAAVRTPERLLWLALMLAAALVVPACGLRLYQERFPGPGVRETERTPQAGPAREIAAGIGALAASLVLLALFNPLSWMRLFRTDYLVGLLLFSGLILWRGSGFPISRRGALKAGGAAAYVILATGAIGSFVMHLVPSGEQWLRFPVLAAASLPLFLHDEQAIRPYRPWWRQWSLFALWRILIWAAVVTGVLLFNPEAAFLVLIAHFVVLAWFPLWWLAGIVARDTGEAGAGALFSALVQGWVFSSLFVTI